MSFIDEELASFFSIIQRIKNKFHGQGIYSIDVDTIVPTIIITPAKQASTIELSRGYKDIDLIIIGLIHGDEVNSIFIINKILEKILKNDVVINNRVGFVLGNIDAFKEGKRYLEQDLNRSFGVNENEYIESISAKNLQKILSRSKYVFDFHQTISPSLGPFIIFRYSASHYRLARYVDENIPIILSMNRDFSLNGTTLNEWARSVGTIAITIEMGERGPSLDQTNMAVHFIEKIVDGTRLNQFLMASDETFVEKNDDNLYLFDGLLKDGPTTQLIPGLKNLEKVEKDAVIANKDSEPIKLKKEGYILFPNYQKKQNVHGGNICFILKKSSLQDIYELHKK